MQRTVNSDFEHLTSNQLLLRYIIWIHILEFTYMTEIEYYNVRKHNMLLNALIRFPHDIVPLYK